MRITKDKYSTRIIIKDFKKSDLKIIMNNLKKEGFKKIKQNKEKIRKQRKEKLLNYIQRSLQIKKYQLYLEKKGLFSNTSVEFSYNYNKKAKTLAASFFNGKITERKVKKIFA